MPFNVTIGYIMSDTCRVHGEFLIMRPLVSETIPDNVTATQNALGQQVAVGLSPPLPQGFGDPGSDGSGTHCHTL